MARKRIAVVPEAPAGGATETAIGDFLAGVRAEGRSPKTFRYYSDVLTKTFLPWCRERELVDLASLDQRALDEFSAYLLDRPERPLAKSSAASYLRAVRTFVKWAGDQGLIPGATLPNGKTVSIAVRPVKVPKKVLETLSPKEIDALEAAADTERDRLIIRVLANCGLRLGELLGLTAADVVQEGTKWFLRVEGRSYGGGAKGDKGRMVPLAPPELGKRLRRLATTGRRPEAYTERIFVTLRRSRRTGAYEPLAERGVQTMLETVAERAGITKRVHPHLLRHSFVTNALRRGVNPVIIAQIAGHRDLSMITNVYQHLNRGDAFDAMMRSLVADESR